MEPIKQGLLGWAEQRAQEEQISLVPYSECPMALRSGMNQENMSLVDKAPKEEFKRYTRRWFMLLVVVMFNISNAIVSIFMLAWPT